MARRAHRSDSADASGGRGLRSAVIVVLVATICATFAAYRPSLDPPSLTPRVHNTAVASAKVMVDRPASVLTAQDADPEAASNLAQTYVQYMRTDQARLTIARNARIPAAWLGVDGPYSTLVNRTSVYQKLPPAPSAAKPRYTLLLDVTSWRTVLTFVASGDDPAVAQRIVKSALEFVYMLSHTVTPQSVPGLDHATLRALGPIDGGTVVSHATTSIWFLVFAAIVLVGLAVTRPRVETRRLRHVSSEPQPDDWPRTKRPLPWALAAFLAMIWLVPFAAMSFPGKLDRVALAGVGFAWGIAFLSTNRAERPCLRLTRIHGIALLFFGICALSIVANATGLATLEELRPALKKLMLISSMLAFLVIAGSTLRPSEIPRLITFMLGLAAFVSVSNIIEYRTEFNIFYTVAAWVPGIPVSQPPDLADTIGRLQVFGPTAHPLEVATMIGIMLMFAIGRAMSTPDSRERWRYVALSALLLSGTLATQRKTGVVAPAVGIVAIAAFRPRDAIRRLLPLALVMGVAAHFLAPGTIGSAIQQLHPSNATASLSTKDRVSDYSGVAPDLTRHLAIGRGYGSYNPFKYRILDNQYLGLAVEIGLIGLLAYFALYATGIMTARKVAAAADARQMGTALGAGGALAVVATANALFDVLSFPHVVYLIFLVLGLLVRLDVAASPLPVPRRAPAAAPERRRTLRREPIAG